MHSSKSDTDRADGSRGRRHNSSHPQSSTTEPSVVEKEKEQPTQSNNTYNAQYLTPEKMICILKCEEEKLVNYDCLVCLLCKRTFKSRELLTKHRSLSELHKTSLDQLKRSLFSKDQIEEAERKEREASYRDRAKERRQKYGTPAEVDNPLKDKYLSAGPSYSALLTRINQGPPSASTERPIESDNVGAKLLSKMGWKEGHGIGKANQGMTDIIKVEARTKNAGLGTKKPRLDPHISYKDAVRMSMYERYKELSEVEIKTQKKD